MAPSLPPEDTSVPSLPFMLSVRAKIFGTFLLAALVMVMSLLFALIANRELDRAARRTVEHSVVEVRAVKDMEVSLLGEDAALARYLLTGDPAWREEMEAERDRFMRSLEEVRAHAANETERSLLREIDEYLPRHRQQIERLLQARGVAGQEAEVASRLRRGNSVLPEIQRRCGQLLVIYQGMLEENSRQADATAVKYRNIGLVTFLMIGGAALALWLLLRFTVLRPIRRLAEGARAYAQGTLEHRVPVLGSDELGELSRTFNEMAAALQRERGRLTEMSITDELTQLKNFRHFAERLEEEVRRAERYGHTLSLILFDIDYFKNYNDTHGHPAGNEVLRVVGRLLRDNARATDILARYGGEEFAAILPETSKVDALGLAEKIRRLIEMHAFPGEEYQPGGALTISAGVAAAPDDASDSPALLEAADKALYAAKHSGRDRVEAYEPEMSLPTRPRRLAGRGL